MNSCKKYLRPFLILTTGTIAVAVTGFFDFSAGIQLQQFERSGFARWMAQTVFEGQGIGGSDFGVLLTIVVAMILVARKWRIHTAKNKTEFRQLTTPDKHTIDRNLKFSIQCGIIAPMVAVHFFKWTISRARPNLYFREIYLHSHSWHELTSQHWLPGFMSLGGPRGYSWNSFPSGHAATSAILLVISYVLWQSRHPIWRLCSLAWFITIMAYVFAMAIARSMAGMHWLSDGCGSFFLVWSIVDLLYIRIFLKTSRINK
jgi:membrane-associated phospholipid phosphatase